MKCLYDRGFPKMDKCPEESWFCGKSCTKVCHVRCHAHNLIGSQFWVLRMITGNFLNSPESVAPRCNCMNVVFENLRL